jgi:type IV secretory pathway VirB2 component (pilin)
VHNFASFRLALIALAAAVTLAATPAPAAAKSLGEEYAEGVGCALANLIYGPVKILYATTGAIVSGFAWAFSAGDTDVAKPIWDASMRGDYVIDIDQLRGRKSIEFIGRSPEQTRVMEPPSEEESGDDGF